VTDSHVAWKVTKAAPANPSPLVIGDEVYIVSDQGIASCLDAKSGEQRWQQRIKGTYSASPLTADGKIYFFSEDGTITVIQPGKEFKELAANHLDGRCFATPAIVGHSLIIRTDTHLYRIEDPARAVAAQ
jgi:outer membrane protein assembly factor BamB